MLARPGAPERIVKVYTQLSHPAKYHLMNISLLAYDSDMADWLKYSGTAALGFIRTVNYLIKNGGYISMHEDGKIRTITYLGWVDEDLQLIKSRRIRLAVDYHKYRYPAIENFEDMRIFRQATGDIVFEATGIDTHEHKIQN